MTIPLDIPVVCNLTESEFVTRRQHILTDLFAKVEGRKELANGYAFRFPNTDEAAQQLLDFVLAERQCCSFFQIELVFKPNSGPVWLYLRGGDGVKDFVETELGLSVR